MQRRNYWIAGATAIVVALFLAPPIVKALGENLIDGSPVIISEGTVRLGDTASKESNLVMYERASAPANPATGAWSVYPKAGGLYYLSDGGTEIGPLGEGSVGGGGSGTDNYMMRWDGTTDAQNAPWTIGDTGVTTSIGGAGNEVILYGQGGYIDLKGSNDFLNCYGLADSFPSLTLQNDGSFLWGDGSATPAYQFGFTGAGTYVIDADQVNLQTASAGATVRFYEDSDNGSNYFEIGSADSRTSDQSVVWPDDTPSDGDFLEWNTGGILEWTAGGSPLTTKGDLYTYDTGDQRLAVGTNNYVLTPDSAQATGLKYAIPFTLQGDLGTPQNLLVGDAIDIAGGDGISTTASASDTATVAVDRTVARDYGTKTSTTTLSNTTTKTSVFSWTVAADEWEVGTQCQLSMYFNGTAFTGTPSLTVTVEDGTNTLATFSYPNLANGQYFNHINLQVTCRSTGASGSIESVGISTGVDQAGAAFDAWSASNVDTIDTTGSNTYTVYAQWDAASAFNSTSVTSAGVLRID